MVGGAMGGGLGMQEKDRDFLHLYRRPGKQQPIFTPFTGPPNAWPRIPIIVPGDTVCFHFTSDPFNTYVPPLCPSHSTLDWPSPHHVCFLSALCSLSALLLLVCVAYVCTYACTYVRACGTRSTATGGTVVS